VGATGPPLGEESGAAEVPSGVQGQSPVGGPGSEARRSKMKLINVLTLSKTAFPQRNSNKSRFLHEKDIFLMINQNPLPGAHDP